MASTPNVNGDTAITIKVSVGENVKKLKLPLKDLTAQVLPVKLAQLLLLSPNQKVTFERFSDSAGDFISLDSGNSAAYKTLVRAAKAKLKLRLRCTVENPDQQKNVPAASKDARDIAIPDNQSTPRSRIPAAGRRSIGTAEKRNVGAGIFDFKESHPATQTKLAFPPVANKDAEAPLPQPFILTQSDVYQKLPLRPLPNLDIGAFPTWSVYCNDCDKAMTNEHFHCNVCDEGDYDLCKQCVDSGKFCPGEGHWLVKRSVKDGRVVSSTTERLPPKVRAGACAATPSAGSQRVPVTPQADMLDLSASDAKTLEEESFEATRTCNSCIAIFPDHQFYSCQTCEDFDLCRGCYNANKHGHHPAHGLIPVVQNDHSTTHMHATASVRHYALCDGCDKAIVGTRHKCFNCPDFDYCSDCNKGAAATHPGHRFAALYEPIAIKAQSGLVHSGIYCDGEACSSNHRQTYIRGVRYKCVICPDFDLCEGCESLPIRAHNITHPLLKVMSPLRGINISATEHLLGSRTRKCPQQSRPTTEVQTALANACKAATRSSASSVKTVAHIEPTSVSVKPADIVKIEDVKQGAIKPEHQDLEAHFVCDTIPDGIMVNQDTRFTQVWTLRNPGPATWPAGCSVRFIGGDNMLNVDHDRPSSAVAMAGATESNVVSREVKPGEEVAFRIVMKASVRPGRAISYWRLKSAAGVPFGHRLWCDITVNVPASEESSSTMLDASSPAPMNPNKQANLSESRMVFPTLDKESPASSTYESSTSTRDVKAKVATIEDEATGDVSSAKKFAAVQSKTVNLQDDEEIFEDISNEIEVLSASSTISDEDGFLTDEEYDVLDASDQETIASYRS